MARTILIWAGILAAGAFLLQWLEAQYLLRVFSRDLYVGIIGAGFAAGGVWLGWKLNTRPRSTPPPVVAEAAGLTGQERRVLAELAAGRSNKEIARALGLSPNTVKSHLANLYAKLEVTRRTQALNRAREVGLIP
jgi:DNA-binding CsgD family transcriptional regulator